MAFYAGVIAISVISLLLATNKVKATSSSGVVTPGPAVLGKIESATAKQLPPVRIADAPETIDLVKLPDLNDSLENLLKMKQTPAENKALTIILYISLALLILIVLAVVAFSFVLPCNIIEKYNSNNNDPNLVDTELYNVSIALIIFSCCSIIGIICTKRISFLSGLSTVFLLTLPSLCVSKYNGNTSISNYTLYVISVCTLVFMLIGVFSIRRKKE
jgi:hypothetical protein